MKDRQEIKDSNPIEDYMEAAGYEIRTGQNELKCLCPFHEDQSPSFSINPSKQTWICRAGCGGGSIIDLVAKMEDMSVGQAMAKLGGESIIVADKPAAKKAIRKPEVKVELTEVAVYPYQDQTGEVIFEVVRYEPKTFKQRKVNRDGSREWKMDGVERTLYKLSEVLASESVWIVEGEKDVDNLAAIGIVATCNPGGAKKWLPAYNQYLEGKAIYIASDNDAVGREHGEMVLKSLEGKVKSVNWVDVPKESVGIPVKDMSDFILSFGADKNKLMEEFILLAKRSRYIAKGIDCGVYSMEEMEKDYIASLHSDRSKGIDLEPLFPGLGIRPLVGGDLVGIVARTGQYKTILIQNICFASPEKTKLIFELEVTKAVLFERFAGMSTMQSPESVEEAYRNGGKPKWNSSESMRNVFVCDKTGMSIFDIDEYIERSSAKIGRVPECVMIDYVQLVRKSNPKMPKYEAVSEAAEYCKTIVKKWNCVGAIVSQANRDKEMGNEVDIDSGKDSGSIENSVGVYLGIWKMRDPKDVTIKVLKNTQGNSGQEVQVRLTNYLRMKST